MLPTKLQEDLNRLDSLTPPMGYGWRDGRDDWIDLAHEWIGGAVAHIESLRRRLGQAQVSVFEKKEHLAQVKREMEWNSRLKAATAPRQEPDTVILDMHTRLTLAENEIAAVWKWVAATAQDTAQDIPVDKPDPINAQPPADDGLADGGIGTSEKT